MSSSFTAFTKSVPHTAILYCICRVCSGYLFIDNGINQGLGDDPPKSSLLLRTVSIPSYLAYQLSLLTDLLSLLSALQLGWQHCWMEITMICHYQKFSLPALSLCLDCCTCSVPVRYLNLMVQANCTTIRVPYHTVYCFFDRTGCLLKNNLKIPVPVLT